MIQWSSRAPKHSKLNTSGPPKPYKEVIHAIIHHFYVIHDPLNLSIKAMSNCFFYAITSYA